MYQPGRHLLQIPGPTNVPLPVLAALAKPTIDHRGPEFQVLARGVLAGLKPIFGAEGPIVIYPASGTGAWEAALVNTLSPGDRVLMYETGWFATLWSKLAERLGLEAELIPGDWRGGAISQRIAERLAEDKGHSIRAVCVVHNETSTGTVSNIPAVRAALDDCGHPALLMVDTISSLGSMEYRHDAWGVDVTVAGSQKGLMLPPGLSFNAVSKKALQCAADAGLARSYWDWREVIAANERGFFPYTPATNMLQALQVAIDLLTAEGLVNVFARHTRAARMVRTAVSHWGLKLQCQDAASLSASLTAVRLPEGHSADALRAEILQASNTSLGNGLGQLSDVVFRIGHLGDFGDAQIAGTVAAVERGLESRGVAHEPGGVEAALRATQM